VRRARELYDETIELAARFGISGYGLWVGVELANIDYVEGAWDAAAEKVAAFFAAVGHVHYMETLARQIQAEMMLARGDAAGAVAQSERSLEFARNAKDLQILYPTLATHAWLLALAGRTAEASRHADELMQLVTAREYHASRWAIILAFTLDEVGRLAEGAPVLSKLVNPTVWREAALAYMAGDRTAAADILGEMGGRTDEAYARLRAAEEGAGAEQRDRALAFYREVGATAHARRAEALLSASA
jgi:ATP/maltotriose-dependent transcriptional regulator MalT